LAHVWSLSVEEQFYLVWPVCFVLLSRRRLSVPVVVAAIGVSAAGRALLHAQGSPLGSYVSTLSRADELLVGALAACLPGVAPERALRYSALGTLALLPIAIVAIDYHDAWLYAGGFTVIALVVAGVILHLAGTSTSVMKRMLESGPLVGAGRISYGLYLFHLPVFKLLEPLGRPHSIVARVMVLVLQCVVTYAVAWLSYRLVEAPVLQRARSLHARVAARRTQHFQPVVLP
jgi:peptidoglycan/LPS O-acetylase OafA/YrhL